MERAQARKRSEDGPRRVGGAVRTPRFFNESQPFTPDVPYRLTARGVTGSDDVPLHYAASLEITLYEGVEGGVTVDGERRRIEGSAVVVAPPMVVHGSSVRGERGSIRCLQISPEALSSYVHLDRFLAERGVRLADAPVTVPECEALRALFDALVREDGDVFARNIAILQIVETVARHIPRAAEREDIPDANAELKRLISWTHANFAGRVALEDAAAEVGFSKHYFCKWFKRRTGYNYIQYVKRVRVYNAARLLSLGKSVSEAAYESGFENISYFIRCFKEIRGCTPKRYADSMRRAEQYV